MRRPRSLVSCVVPVLALLRAWGHGRATAVDVGGDGRTLTVHVIGAQERGSEPCGEDYSVSTVTDDAAVAIVVVRHPYRGPDSDTIACTLVGAERQAVTVLDADLAGRPVLDAATALPVPVT